jgi:hypothetical protein
MEQTNMSITTTRTDCKRDNNLVYLPNAAKYGFGLTKASRGNWIRYATDDDSEHSFVGRVISRVTCEGKIFIEIAQASLDFSCAYVRWIKPEQVRECRKNPPRSVFEFFAANNWDNPEDIHAALAYGVSDLQDQYNKVI